ncbi:universal stress protein [Variovorax rhizosphaerae]|uniref:Universal stress protein n=1 Tax=Variovorax rhizosphaerae TaxID=1836200 RepID=A0ABU8WW04_9BURK
MKTCIVGFTQDAGGREALALARTIAGRGNVALVVCVVTPESWGPTSLGADAQYSRFLEDHAKGSLDEARALMGDTPNVRYAHVGASSASVGLTQAAERERADLIVLGYSGAGSIGRVFLGSATDELLHSASRPVAIAPPGFAGASALTRVTVGFSGSEAAHGTVLHALGLAGALGLPLRLASFEVRERLGYAARVGPDVEQSMLDRQTAQTQAALDAVKNQIAVTGYPVETAIGVGGNWDEALASAGWQEGDLLLLGSSRLGVLQRVFIGSNATKIVRASPVPVLVVPRQG